MHFEEITNITPDTMPNSRTVSSNHSSTNHAQKLYIEEADDIDASPAINPMEIDLFDHNGPLLIEVRHGSVTSLQNSNSPSGSSQQNTNPTPNLAYQDSSGVFWDINTTAQADLEDEAPNQSDTSREENEDEVPASDEEDGEDTDGSDDNEDARDYAWSNRQPPSLEAASKALADINLMLKPRCAKGAGYKQCQLPLVLRTRLEWIASFLHVYTSDSLKYGQGSNGSRWMASSLHAAHAQQSNPTRARNLRKWAKAFITNRDALPVSPNGTARHSRIEDEDVAAEIATHLQSLGPYVRALDIVHYTAIPEVRTRLNIKKTISLATAQRWMKKMGYRWTKKPSGQYVDGHERADVVYYRQSVFLPAWAELYQHTRLWTAENVEIINEALANGRTVVVWFHDKCTFYANDRRIVRWVHKDETAVPRAKGEGASLMVADFISADYGWLSSPDGSESTRVVF